MTKLGYHHFATTSENNSPRQWLSMAAKSSGWRLRWLQYENIRLTRHNYPINFNTTKRADKHTLHTFPWSAWYDTAHYVLPKQNPPKIIKLEISRPTQLLQKIQKREKHIKQHPGGITRKIHLLPRISHILDFPNCKENNREIRNLQIKI